MKNFFILMFILGFDTLALTVLKSEPMQDEYGYEVFSAQFDSKKNKKSL